MKMITDLQDDVVTPNVMQLGDGPLTDIGVEPGSVLRDDWDGVSDAITMQAQSAEKARKMQQLADVAFAKAGDKEAAKRVESDALLGWALTAEAAADAENTEDVLGTQLARRYGTGDPGAVWDAMNASADYEYEQMPAWNTRAEGMRLVWGRFQKMVQGKKAAADAAQAERENAFTGVFRELVLEGSGVKKSGDAWGRFYDGLARGVFRKEDEVAVRRAADAWGMLEGVLGDGTDAGANVLTQGSTGQLIMERLRGDELAQWLFFSALQARVQDMRTSEQERSFFVRFARAFEAADKLLVAGLMGGHFRAFVSDKEVEAYNAELEKLRESTGVERPNVALLADGDSWFERVLPLGNKRLEAVHKAARESGQLNEDGSLRRMSEEERASTQVLNEFRGRLFNAVNGVYDVPGVAARFGKMLPGSLLYVVPGGAPASFGSMRTQYMANELAESKSWAMASSSGSVNAAIQAAVEKIAFGSLNPGKMVPGMDWLMSRPVMARALGGLYGSTAGRVGMGVALGGAEETFLEPAAGLILGGVYNAVAGTEMQLDSPLEEYRKEMEEMLKPDQLLATALYGLLLGGVSVGAQMDAAESYRKVRRRLLDVGVDEGRAAQVARMENAVERMQAVQGLIDERLKVDAAGVLGYVAELYPQLQEMATVENYFDKGMLPKVLPAEESGMVKVQERDAEGNVQESVMSEEAARLLVEARLEELNGQEQAEMAEMVLANAMVGAVSKDGKRWAVSVEDAEMNHEYFERLARAAGVRLSEGARADEVDPNVHPFVPLGQLVGHGEAWEQRMKVARHEYEQKNGAVSDAQWEKVARRMVSRVNRTGVRGADGRLRTVLRVARGGFGTMEVLEDVTEDNLVRDMEVNGRSLDFYVNNIRELEAAMGKPGAFLRELKDGESEYDRLAVVEAMGKLVQSKVLADTARKGNGLSAALNAFLDLIRSWVLQAKALMKLGAMLNKALSDKETMEKLAPEFLGDVDRLVAQDVEWLQSLQLKEGLEAMQRVYAAQAEAKADRKVKRSKRAETPVLDRAMAQKGDEVRKEQAEKEKTQAEVQADVEAAEAAVDGDFSASLMNEEELDKPMVSVASDDVPEDKPSLVARLKELTGRKFYNKAAGMQATISGESAKKIARAEVETIINLTRLGYTEDEASYIHRAAASKIGELYEQAVLFFEEEVYHKTDDRKAAWHFFEPVTVDLGDRNEAFLTNISVIDFTHGGERLFSLELTIENPISHAEGRTAPASGRPAQHTNGVSDVRVAAFESFVKKEKAQIERNAREKGLVPWRIDEARVHELQGEVTNIQKEIDALLDKFGGDEEKLDAYRRDRRKLYELRELLAKKQAAIAAEYKPDSLPEVAQPIAPNGKPSHLSVDAWLMVRTKAFKAWFGDWENDPANASKVVDENGEPLVVYHGTPTGGFTIFRDESYFSPLMWYAEKYKNPAASSNRSSRDVGTPMLYEVFLNIRKPFDTRNATEKKIFETDFFRKWGNGAPLSERGLPDWTDATDLLEFIEENELDYDGLILDEGGYPDGNDGVILRGHSFVPVTPTQIKSATDNRGTFDGNNPDITYSVTGGKNLAAVSPEMDARYMAAVERGDMDAAQRMVNEVARKRGYLPGSDYQGSEAFNGVAPSSNAYFDTEDERYEAWQNGDFEGDISLADFVRRGMDPGELEWLVTSPGAYQRADKYKRESFEAIRKAKTSKQGKVTIYRAVPADVKEKSVRNGDWVTLSKAYAEYHISLQDWEKGRIIKQEVSIDDVWWDGNDVNEWGYDDGKEYAYRNTANNRKLLAPVTYDENGDIVPLSKRFNYRSADVSFSVIGRKAKTWGKYTDKAFAGRDDGLWRAEIDASQAKLKWEDLRGKNVAAYRKLVAGWEKLPEEVRKAVEAYAEEVYDWQEESERLDSVPESEFLEQYNKVQKMRDAIKPKREEMRSLLNKLFVEHGGSAGAVLNMKSGELDELAMSLWGPYVESKVEDMLDLRPLWNGGMKLADVLEYPELYEAYPELADITVHYATMDTARGRAIYGDGEREILINRNLEGEWREIHSILLHEIQHHIQNIEGFAKGGNPSSARRLVDKRAAMGDADALALREHSDMELYLRIAGEIEARNVQHRMDWSADKRAAIPFNETLEYPGEALMTFSVQSVTADWKNALDKFVQNPPAAGSVEYRSDMYVCPTPAVMQMVGARAYDIVLSPDVLVKCLDENIVSGVGKTLKQLYPKEKRRHAITLGTMGQLPASLAEPVCIMVSDTPGCVEVVTELKEGADNILVAVQLNALREGSRVLKVNRIVSLYGKEHITNLLNHPCLYWDKAKARIWTGGGGLQSSTAPYPKRASGRKILKPADLVKYKEQHGMSFSMINPDVEALAGEVVAAGQGFRANLAFSNQIVKEMRDSLQRMKRLGSKSRTEREDAIAAMGTMVHVVKAAVAYLPKGYRFSVHPYLKKLEVLAELATTGNLELTAELNDFATRPIKEFVRVQQVLHDVVEMKGQGELETDMSVEDLLKEYGEAKLTDAMERIMHRVAEQLRKHAKDKAVQKIKELVERMRPKKDKKTGKLKGGKMSADAYRDLDAVYEAMNMSAEELEGKLAVLNEKMNKPGISEDERMQVEGELMLYDQFGDLKGMSAEGAVEAYEALRQRVWFHRFEWENVMAERRAMRRAVVRRVVDGVGSVSENEYNAKKRRVKPVKRLRHLGDILAGLPAVLRGLHGYLPLRELAQDLTLRANRAGEQLKAWESERWVALEALSRETMGKSWRLCMDDMHEVKPTGVAFDRPKYRTVSYRTDGLRVLLEMTPEERKTEMQKRREAGGKEAETVLTERDVEALAEKLVQLEAEVSDAESKRRKVPATIEVRYLKEMQHEENLELSRGEALYAILMYEQPTYTERMEAQGYTPEVIEGLRRFVGEGMLEFGYGLRELFAKQGDRVAAVYERVYGVPFPREENYFAARWDVTEVKGSPAEQLLAGMSGTPGAGKGWQKQRVNHDLELDMTKDALQVFLQATSLTDTWMATQDIVEDFKAWTRDKDFVKALTVLLGKDGYDNLIDWIRILEMGGVQDCLNMGASQDVINGIYGSGAVAILGFRVQTLLKQVPAIFNGLLGAHDISTAEWFATLSRMKNRTAPMTFRKMLDSTLLKNRMQGRAGELKGQAMRSGDMRSSMAEELLLASMLPMEWTDACCTAVSLVPVWNVYYQRAIEKNASVQEAERMAWEQTAEVANLSSQPIGWLNKSKIVGQDVLLYAERKYG